MIVYLDSSIILRRLLGQPDALREWRLVRTAVSSRLTEVECLRTIDRLRLQGAIDERRVVSLRETLYRLLATAEVVEVTRTILSRAAQPSPTSLSTLDAIHLCSALVWQERTGGKSVLATHDQALALAARAQGFRVMGT
jgi:hypothetical protein